MANPPVLEQTVHQKGTNYTDEPADNITEDGMDNNNTILAEHKFPQKSTRLLFMRGYLLELKEITVLAIALVGIMFKYTYFKESNRTVALQIT